jgi:hypothetical protein
MNINALLDQARSLRQEASDLMHEVVAAAEGHSANAPRDSQTLDELAREGGDPARLEAFLAQRQARYETAKKNEEALDAMTKRFGEMFDQLAAEVDIKDTSGEQAVLQGAVRLCIETMAELGDAIKAAMLETSVAAALAGKSQSGLIIGAAAAKPHIILPPGFKRAS